MWRGEREESAVDGQTALLATKAERGSAKARERERGRERAAGPLPSFSSAFGPWLKRLPLTYFPLSLFPPFLKSVMPLRFSRGTDRTTPLHSAFAFSGSEKREKMRWVHRGNRKSPPTPPTPSPQPRARAPSPFRFGGLFEGGRSRENAAQQLVDHIGFVLWDVADDGAKVKCIKRPSSAERPKTL